MVLVEGVLARVGDPVAGAGDGTCVGRGDHFGAILGSISAPFLIHFWSFSVPISAPFSGPFLLYFRIHFAEMLLYLNFFSRF